MFIILKDYDNGEVYEEHYWFTNQVVTNDDENRVLTFATLAEIKAYVHAQYQCDPERTEESEIVRDDDSTFSYTNGYDAITGYKWVDLNNPVIPVSDLIADFYRNH